MKKIENKKQYIQIIDVLVIEENNILMIPRTIFDKIFNMCGRLIDSSHYDKFIEIETDEEKEFFDDLDFIYDEEFLNSLSSEELTKELEKVNESLNKHARTYEESNASFDKMDYFNKEERLLHKKEFLSKYINKKSGSKKLNNILVNC